MSTKFLSPGWRMPRNANQIKQSNYSLNFGGGTDYVSIGSVPNLFISSWSISFWFKAPSIGNTNGTIISRYRSANATGDLEITSTSGQLYFETGGGFPSTGAGAGGNQIRTTSTSLDDGNWHHIAFSLDYTSGTSTRSLYVDGSLDVSDSTTTPAEWVSQTENLVFGVLIPASNSQYNGFINDVSIFDYTISPSQVTTLYGDSTNGVGNPMALPSPPIAYYPLGTSAYNGEYLAENNAIGDYVFDFGTFTSNDRIVINDTFDTIITGTNFTISSWINLDSVLSNQIKFIFTNESLQLTITDKITTYLRGASGYFLNPFNSNTTLTTGKWYNVVFVKSGSDYTYYLNGSADGTVNNSTSVVNSSQTTSIIGMYYSGSYGFDGKMSNVQIFDSALSSTEIETLYNYGSPIQTLANIPQNSNLKAWYKLDASEIYNSTTTEWSIDNNQNPSAYSSSLDFDSADDDYISLPTITLTDNWSVSVWMNKTDYANRSQAVGMSTGTGFWAYGGDIRGGGSTAGKLSYYNGASMVALSNERLDDGNWHNWIISYDHSTTTLKCYIDGQENYSDTYNAGTGNTINRISNSFTGSNYWLGQLSNISIWNAALTPAQVTELYNNGTPSNLSSHSATSNLVSWYKLNNTTTGIEDSKGSNNGTNNGATEYTGFVNKLIGESSGMSQANLVQSDLQTVAPYSKYAMEFDASSSDYIDCGDSDDFSFGNDTTDSPFSVSFFVNLNSYPQYNCVFVSKDDGSPNREYAIGMFGNTYARFFIKNAGGNNQQSVDSTTTIALGSWYHVVATYDGRGGSDAADGMNLYINSINETTGAVYQSYNAMANTTAPFRIGQYNSQAYVDGKISNVSVWNTELTSSQVTEIYNEGLPGNLNSHSAYSNLVSWWQLGENSSFDGNDWIVADEKGTNNGTSVSMPVGALVNGVGTTANGVSSGMSEGNLVGDAPYSTANALSTNMVITSRVSGSGNTP